MIPSSRPRRPLIHVPRALAERIAFASDGVPSFDAGPVRAGAVEFAERFGGVPTILNDGRVVYWDVRQGLRREAVVMTNDDAVNLAGIDARLRMLGWEGGEAFRGHGSRLLKRWARLGSGAPLVIQGGVEAGAIGGYVARWALNRRAAIDLDSSGSLAPVALVRGGYVVRVDSPELPRNVKAVARAVADGGARAVFLVPRAWVPPRLVRMIGIGAAVVELSDDLVSFGREIGRPVIVVSGDLLALSRVIGAGCQRIGVFRGKDGRAWHISPWMKPRPLTAKLLHFHLAGAFRFVRPDGTRAKVPPRAVLSAVIAADAFLERLGDLHRGPQGVI